VSGESLVLLLFGLWVVLTAVVLIPTMGSSRSAELADQGGSAFVEDFVEAVARGDLDAAERAAASVFGAARPGVTAAGGPGALPSTW
jgi:hypothetical protein